MQLVAMNGNEPITTSLIVAEGTDSQHRAVLQLIKQNLSDFEEFGRVAFEMQPFETAGGPQNRTIAVLNREHAMLLMTYMRNSPIVRDFKKRLIKAFVEMEVELTKAQSFDPSQLTRMELLQIAMSAETERLELEAKNKELSPKADAYDSFMDAAGTYSVGTVAQILGMGQNKLFRLLRNEGIFIASGSRRNTPYQKYLHHFEVIAHEYEKRGGEIGCSYTTYVQPSGVDFIRRKLHLNVIPLNQTVA